MNRREEVKNQIYLVFNEYLDKEQEIIDLIQQSILEHFINHKKVLMELENYFYIF
jgi:hypothetical protein